MTSSLAPKDLLSALASNSWQIPDPIKRQVIFICNAATKIFNRQCGDHIEQGRIPAGPDNSNLLQREDISFVHLVDPLQHRFTYADDRSTFFYSNCKYEKILTDIHNYMSLINQ